MDPVRIGIVALLISRPSPMLNLFAFWLGGMATGIALALVVLLYLRDFTLSVMRVVVSVVSGPIVAQTQLAVGVLALQIAGLIAARLWARRRAPVPVTGGGPALQVLEPNTPTRSSRLSIRGQLERGSLQVAFVAGMWSATPPVEYVGAIIAILASGAAVGAQVSAALLFTLVAFAVVEVPLIGYLATPAKTQAILLRLHEWIRTRRQPVFAVVVGACGALLVVTGMGNV
jgi:hypothetical protein